MLNIVTVCIPQYHAYLNKFYTSEVQMASKKRSKKKQLLNYPSLKSKAWRKEHAVQEPSQRAGRERASKFDGDARTRNEHRTQFLSKNLKIIAFFYLLVRAMLLAGEIFISAHAHLCRRKRSEHLKPSEPKDTAAPGITGTSPRAPPLVPASRGAHSIPDPRPSR